MDRQTLEWSPKLVLYLCECHDTRHKILSAPIHWARDCEDVDWGICDRFLESEDPRIEEGKQVRPCIGATDVQLLQRSQRLKQSPEVVRDACELLRVGVESRVTKHMKALDIVQ